MESMSESPPRKRMRLSSPTFDVQVGELSQDDIDAFDSLDAQLSQSTRYLPSEDEDNPFRLRIHPPFTKASVFQPSDEAEQPPPAVDYAAWFDPHPSNSLGGFSTATAALPGFQRASANGQSTKPLFIPSAAALREAEEKMRKWQEEVPDQLPPHDEPDSHRPTQIASPPPAAFFSARNAFSVQAPETPTPLFRSANTELTPSKSHRSLQSLDSKRQTRPFKSPLMSANPSISSHRRLSTPSIGSPLRGAVAPSQPAPVVSPLRPSLVANHVPTQKPLGFTPRHGTVATRPKFVTPFKTIVKSSTLKASAVESTRFPTAPPNPRTIVNRVYPPSVSSSQSTKRNSGRRVFDLVPPPDRQTLGASGLRPQTHSAEQLEDMGINFRELCQVNPRTAPFYTFTTPMNQSDSSSALVLGRLAVLEELYEKGCTLAKQTWVDNHWSLVLWKLAGMVVLEPASETDPFKKRWCWPEVIRQFMYRYERDLNGSSRPPFRLITARDASAESPMVLCVSDIIWPAGGSEEDVSTQSHPELEVTDGWYRLRARVDAPLARGVRKGKIKIGRKIAVAGAKLSAERKDGAEILEAYHSNVLLLTGNSTHMAPWHAKLGFQCEPFIATLNSLTADGGNVAVMLLTVMQSHPVAYIEFAEGPDGSKQRVGPHDSREELKLSTEWKTKRELHASRLWSDYEKRRCRLLDYAERLEQRAGSKFMPRQDDGPPDKIYDMYDTLQEDIEAAKGVMSSIGQEDAGWLAYHIREKAVQERDDVSREIERELELTCPPRDVKAFCVVVVNDARTYKYPPRRTAQITVWDVPGVLAAEGCSQGPFVADQRYLVTNLAPTQVSAWMDHRSSGGEVYLSTRKNSKWTLLK